MGAGPNFQFINDVGAGADTLANGGLNNATRPATFTVSNPAAWPTVPQFTMLATGGAASEILLVTAVAGASFTATNTDGTTAVAHPQGTNIYPILTRSSIRGIINNTDSVVKAPIAAGALGSSLYLADTGHVHQCGYSFISETVMTTTTASVTFSSIPATFSHLVFTFLLRGDAATTGQEFRIQLNGDTGTNYDSYRVEEQGASASPGTTEQISQAQMVATYLAANAPASEASRGEFWLFNYANSSNFKEGQSAIADRDGTGTTNQRWRRAFLLWKSTAAVTSVKFFPQTNNLVGTGGGIITMYGVI